MVRLLKGQKRQIRWPSTLIISVIVICLARFDLPDELIENITSSSDIIYKFFDEVQSIPFILFPTSLLTMSLLDWPVQVDDSVMTVVVHIIAIASIVFLWIWRPQPSLRSDGLLIAGYVVLSALINPVLWVLLLYT